MTVIMANSEVTKVRIVTCIVCGSVFPTGRKRRSVYCSQKCFKKAQTEKNKSLKNIRAEQEGGWLEEYHLPHEAGLSECHVPAHVLEIADYREEDRLIVEDVDRVFRAMTAETQPRRASNWVSRMMYQTRHGWKYKSIKNKRKRGLPAV